MGKNEPQQGAAPSHGPGPDPDPDPDPAVVQFSPLKGTRSYMFQALMLMLVLTLALAPSGMISKKDEPEFCP